MTLPPGISLRAISDGDREFLYSVYASTRAHEMSLVNWNDAQKEAFVRMQFNAQHQYYRSQFPQASFDLIVREGTPIGRLYLLHEPDETRIIDITLLPEHRGKGIGTSMLKEILAQAERASKPVRIHVERFNPALQLYARLGFEKVGDAGVYYLLEKPVKRD